MVSDDDHDDNSDDNTDHNNKDMFNLLMYHLLHY
jgi:hypothetical protein